jgi:hypothetical protein
VILSQSSDSRRLQYITKLAMAQSQKTPVPPPPKYKVMYPEDATVRSVKISSVHKIVLQDLCQNLQLYKILVNKKIHFHLLISVRS